MNPYEGLNLPQLMDLLQPVVDPQALSWWPQTRGWAVLAAWLVIVLFAAGWQGWKRWQANRYRREALDALEQIRNNPDQDQAVEIAILLKRTALAAWPRTRVAQLFGKQWAEFLCESSGHDARVVAAADSLAAAAYSRQTDAAGLLEPARRWIEVHRA